MEQRQKVALLYLREVLSAMDTYAVESKKDKASQTKAVETLMQKLLRGPLSDYANKVYAVGGSVRDQQLGRSPKDLDIVVVNDKKGMAAAEDFANALVDTLNIRSDRQPQILNENYGIYGVTLFRRGPDGKRKPFLVDGEGNIVEEGGTDISGYVIEMTPPRKEGEYLEDSRRPANVEYATIKEDQERRDLTINAVYKNIATGELIDHVGGLDDIKNEKLRPPEQSEKDRSVVDIYREDPLRILRLIRFQDKTGGWGIPEELKGILRDFIKENKSFILKKLSKERIADEFLKIITGNDPVRGLETMKDLGILWMISPDLEKMLDVYHDTVFHSGESVWEHTMDVLKNTPPTPKARLAALFHDIGKVGTKPDPKGKSEVPIMTTRTDAEGRDRVHFVGHEISSGKMIRKILKDLKLDSLADSVAQIAEAHMGFKSWEGLKDKTLLRRMRILIERLYNDLDDAIAILKADESTDKSIDELERKIKAQKDEDIRNGLLRERGGKIEYVVPLDYKQAIEEYQDLKGQIIGMVTSRLKKALLAGKITDETSAKKELDSIMRQSKQFEQLLAKYEKEKRNPEFYRACC